VGACAVQHLTVTWCSCMIPSNAAETCARMSCPATSGSELSQCVLHGFLSASEGIVISLALEGKPAVKQKPAQVLDWVLGRLWDDLLNSAIETNAISG